MFGSILTAITKSGRERTLGPPGREAGSESRSESRGSESGSESGSETRGSESRPPQFVFDWLDYYRTKIHPLREEADAGEGTYNAYDEAYNEHLESLHDMCREWAYGPLVDTLLKPKEEYLWIDFDPWTDADWEGPRFLIRSVRVFDGGDDKYLLSRRPGTTNMGGESKLYGWLGETNNISRYAEGLAAIVQQDPIGQRAKVRRVKDRGEILAALEWLGWPELSDELPEVPIDQPH